MLTCLAPFPFLELRSVLATELLPLMLLRLLEGLDDLDEPAFELAPPLCIGMLAFCCCCYLKLKSSVYFQQK